MQTFAHIESGVVREVIELPDDARLQDCYVSEFVAACVPVANSGASQGWTWDGTTFAAPSPPSPAAIPTVAVEFTSAPALNGAYEVTQGRLDYIQGITTMTGRGRVPGGGSTFPYPDAGGTDRNFDAGNFTKLADALADYFFALSRGETPSLPLVIA